MHIQNLILCRGLVMDAMSNEFSLFGLLDDLILEAPGSVALNLLACLSCRGDSLQSAEVELAVVAHSGQTMMTQKITLPTELLKSNPAHIRVRLEPRLSLKEAGLYRFIVSAKGIAVSGPQTDSREIQCLVSFRQQAAAPLRSMPDSLAGRSIFN